MRVNLSDSVLGNSFLGMTWKTESTEGKKWIEIHWMLFIIITDLLCLRDTTKKSKYNSRMELKIII